MTLFKEQRVACAVCGRVSRQAVQISGYIAGPVGLDTRRGVGPSLQACPACGYVAADLSSKEEVGDSVAVTETVRSDRYQDQLRDERYDRYVNQAVCMSIIKDKTSPPQDSGWAWMQAAWYFDDCDPGGETARLCRVRALRRFQAARSERRGFADDEAVERGILTDLLRRLGRFGEALEECQRGLGAGPEAATRRVLEIQTVLIKRRDSEWWSVDEATREIEGE